jgi:hypothetical protein
MGQFTITSTIIHKTMDGKIQNFISDAMVIDVNNPFIECIVYQY